MNRKMILVAVLASATLLQAADLIGSGRWGRLTYCTYEGRCTTPNGASATITSTAFRNDGNCPAKATISAPLNGETCTSSAILVATGDTTIAAYPAETLRVDRIQLP